jgi:hypothetical protein
MLIESMRDIGYTLESALADVVDNSITAGASKIELFAETTGSELKVGIIDDGEGMSEAELFAAMRPGSRNPRQRRSASDLGRFGLGLKTAAFSQCRRLTVVTKTKAGTSAAIWDLDHVASTDAWLVQIPDNTTSIPWVDRLGKTGTVIVWEKLDRLAEPDGSDNAHPHFVRQLDEAREHLEMVFHRFLSGERGLRKIQILLNGRPLEPFDPFHTAHQATDWGPIERIRVGHEHVVVQTFTLPHHSKVSADDWERYGGRLGYLKNQGFYVYRAKRLIIHGTWFGLTRQTEHTKLARVRIDMPNGLDSEWKIDVKKASAQPPYQVRERLRRIIETIGAGSRRVYTGRGRTLTADHRLPVWNRVQAQNEIHYRLNREHPVLADFDSRLPDDMRNEFLHVLEIAGSTIPMDSLFADFGSSPEKMTGITVSDETLCHAIRTTVNSLSRSGIQSDEIREMLRVAEPFRSHWERTEALLADPPKE